MKQERQERGREILTWYQKNKRDLPWRHTRDPYRIWISEIMLQQTRVEAAIEYYLRFLEKFPDVQSLAQADDDAVLAAWQGLGYYSRARNLHKAAKIIAARNNGRFPAEYAEVKALPGIGLYTAGAILSIALNQPYPAVDGNVLRVVSRLEGSGEDIAQESARKNIANVVMEMMPSQQARDFNQGLMELGALICIPGSPRCLACPVHSLCNAFATGRQNELPVKKKKDGPVPELEYTVAVVEADGKLLLEYRKDETLLGRMWGLPMVERQKDRSAEALFEQKYGIQLQPVETLGTATHVFTHRVWKMEAVMFAPVSIPEVDGTLHWVTSEERSHLAVPVAFQKVFSLI